MRTIADLNATEFLRQTNRIRKTIQGPLATLDIVGILRTPPEEDVSKMTPEERTEAGRKQGAKNLNRLFDLMLEEKPEETVKLVKLLVIPDDGEELKGKDIIKAITMILKNQDIMDFFTSLTR